jgi:hypothetical protein
MHIPTGVSINVWHCVTDHSIHQGGPRKCRATLSLPNDGAAHLATQSHVGGRKSDSDLARRGWAALMIGIIMPRTIGIQQNTDYGFFTLTRFGTFLHISAGQNSKCDINRSVVNLLFALQIESAVHFVRTVSRGSF